MEGYGRLATAANREYDELRSVSCEAIPERANAYSHLQSGVGATGDRTTTGENNTMRPVLLKARFLDEWLTRRNISIYAFAKKTDITAPCLRKILRGETQPSARTRAKLQVATGLEWDELFEIAGAIESEGV